MAVLAPCLVTLRSQCNTKWPMRSKASDGWIGDQRHCGGANPNSDHCSVGGVVRAVDITNDPAHGLDSGQLAETLKTSRDPRLKYVISNARIWNPSISPAWRPYSGSNAHTKHVHVSCVKGPAENSTAPWNIDGVVTAPVTGVPVVTPSYPVLKLGSKGVVVVRLQTLLNKNGAKLIADGDYGKKTGAAVLSYQKAYVPGVTDWGKVGPKTWAALELNKPPEADRDQMPAQEAGPDFDRIVKHYEGKETKIYSIGGLLHGGYGHQLAHNEGWKVGNKITEAQIEAWYQEDRALAEKRLLKHIAKPLNQAQFDAVCSIIWNGGDWNDPTDKADSPLFYRTKSGILVNSLNVGTDASEVIEALGSKPARDGKVYAGIRNRRLTELERYQGKAYRLR
jgi:GH24 family phage-related lysozyme (muramidase)